MQPGKGSGGNIFLSDNSLNQSTSQRKGRAGLHVAIIPDGNGRWARVRGLDRTAGHRAGVEAVRRVVRGAPVLGIGTLTFFAFSSANWGRPAAEVREILGILEDYFRDEIVGWRARGVRVRVFGRRDRLPAGLRAAVETAERSTACGAEFTLRLALDYSAREALLRSACRLYTALEISPEAFARLLDAADGRPVPDVDLLIRAGGEQRLSDFLLWEIANAELIFTERMWPDFSEADLREAVREFHRRERRFGRLPEAAAG